MEKTTEFCRVCGSNNLTPILSLGDLYVSNFIEADDVGEPAPLDLILCSEKDGGCGLLQLKHTVSGDQLYRNYWYRSGMNKTMTDELVGIARKIENMVDLKSGDYVMDIGANDGTLLRGFSNKDIKLTGFEPAKNLIQYNQEGTTKVIPDFFTYESWKREFGEAKAKAITAIAMFYDLDDPNSFVGDIKKSLHDEGVFVIQMMYLPSFLEKNAFDGICHEHLEYYSLLSLENLLKRHDLEVFDVEMREHINEGSFRVYIKHKGQGSTLKISDGAEKRIEDMRQREKSLGLGDKQIYGEFAKRIEGIKKELTDFIRKEKAQGKKIYVYGASTKGNTLLQYFDLNSDIITAAAERNPDKWGKKTVGTNIPIISEEQARRDNPDYFLILPWHFLPEFKQREEEYLKGGGKFIVPLPEFKIVEWN